MYSSGRVHTFDHGARPRGMYASTGGRVSDIHGGPAGGGYYNRSVAGQYLDMGNAREDELRRLESDVRNSRLEEERLRAAIAAHEAVVQRNEKELNSYRESMLRRDEEMRRLRSEEAYRLQVVLEEYRSRFERERTRLGLALQKTDACTKIISEVLPECIECERELLGGSGQPGSARAAEGNSSFGVQSQLLLS